MASTVRGIDPGSLARPAAESRKRFCPRQIAVDEVYLGERQKFITVADDLESAAPVAQWGAEAGWPRRVKSPRGCGEDLAAVRVGPWDKVNLPTQYNNEHKVCD
jgi:hypothetical protein